MADLENANGLINNKVRSLIDIKKDIAKAINEQSSSANASPKEPFQSLVGKVNDLQFGSATEVKSLEVTKNGTYIASKDNAKYYTSVTVKVPSSGGGGSGGGGGGGSYEEEGDLPTFTVNFYGKEYGEADNEIIYTANDVPLGGNVTFPHGQEPTKEDPNTAYTFKTWNPNPLNIQKDTDCYPQFKSLDEEIADSWEAICACKGMDYDIGEFKTLITKPVGFISGFEVNSSEKKLHVRIRRLRIAAVMQKVLGVSSEDNTNSTWLSRYYVMGIDGNDFTIANITRKLIVPLHMLPGVEVKNKIAEMSVENYSGPNFVDVTFDLSGALSKKYLDDIDDINKDLYWDWSSSFTNEYLNSTLLSALPDYMQNAIISATKISSGYYKNDEDFGFLNTELETSCKLWVPSIRELAGSCRNYEQKGPIYYRNLSHKAPPCSWDTDSGSDKFSVLYETVRSVPRSNQHLVSPLTTETYIGGGSYGTIYGHIPHRPKVIAGMRLGFSL